MLHPLEQVRDHQNPLADTPALVSCQPPQLDRPRFAAKEVCRHRRSPKCGTHAQSLYHISEPPEAGIIPEIGGFRYHTQPRTRATEFISGLSLTISAASALAPSV